MNPKYGYWVENTYKLDFRCLNFLPDIVETFNSFNMEKAGKEMNLKFKEKLIILYNKTQQVKNTFCKMRYQKRI